MTTMLTQFAAESTSHSDGGIFGALGIDVKMLVFQIIGFVVLVWLMGKFVYPVLMKTVDERQSAIEAGTKAAAAAEEKAAKAEADVEKLMAKAKKDASAIVATAKDEADLKVETADKKAKERAERIVADAHDQLQKDVLAARKALHNDTIELVAQATEKIVGSTVMTKSIDDKIIAKAVKELN